MTDKRPIRLHRAPDARFKAVDRRARLRCIFSRPFGHWKDYSSTPEGVWRCRCCGALGHYDPYSG